MKLYNALTQTTNPFHPSDPVSIYVCGITPYDTTHLGHAFTYSLYDILIRYLEYQGHRVRYVQNVTDIDDDILRKAQETGENWQTLGNRWTARFIQDLMELNIRPPDVYPRATAIIPHIIEHVQKLVDLGVAYEAGGNVYYHIASWPEFGKLCHLPPDEMLPVANERGNFPDDPLKRDALDFVLWQAQQAGEPAWESPWGPGRPGWHIECSAMAMYYLGESIDIHGGGGDLIFPHHECGIAQVEVLTKKTFTQVWMHAAMVHYEKEKMSKSLGNLIMIRDLLRRYSPDAIRLYLAKHHYRQPWEFDERHLVAQEPLVQLLRQAATVPKGTTPPSSEMCAAYASSKERFLQAMEADLDTPAALVALEEMAVDVLQDAKRGYDVRQARAQFRLFAAIFGLRLDTAEPEARVTLGWNRHLCQFPVPGSAQPCS
ncbi:MAG: cysteine--tRNA ligase [Chloroflexi bacterium]|nr:cysteine--tRNA ligase [Chloroflexota bacterium]